MLAYFYWVSFILTETYHWPHTHSWSSCFDHLAASVYLWTFIKMPLCYWPERYCWASLLQTAGTIGKCEKNIIWNLGCIWEELIGSEVVEKRSEWPRAMNFRQLISSAYYKCCVLPSMSGFWIKAFQRFSDILLSIRDCLAAAQKSLRLSSQPIHCLFVINIKY